MLLRHTLAYLPAQLLGPLLQLAAALALTHALGAADYGLTMLVFAAQELVFLVCLSWWTTFYLRYGGGADASAGGADGDGAALAAGEVAILLASSVAQLVATLAVLALAGTWPGTAFAAAACAFTVSRCALGFLAERARRRAAFVAYTAVQVAAPAGGLALTLAAMAVAALTPVAVLLLFALAQTAVALAVAVRLGLAVAPAALPRAVLRQALAFGAPVVVSNTLSWLGGNVIRFVVQHGAGAAALGLLSVGWGLATRLAGVAAMLVTAAAYPLAVRAMERGDSAGARRQMADNALLLWALLAPAAVGAAVLVQPFSVLLVAAEYRQATLDVLPWAIAGAALRNLRMHGWDPLYLLHEAPRRMVVLDAAEVVATLVCAVLGLWWHGLVGAVIGTAVAAALVAAGDAWWLRRRFGLLLHAGAMARVAAAALAMGAVLAAALHLGLAQTAGPPAGRTRLALELLGAVALGTLVYALALAALFPRAIAAWQRRRGDAAAA